MSKKCTEAPIFPARIQAASMTSPVFSAVSNRCVRAPAGPFLGHPMIAAREGTAHMSASACAAALRKAAAGKESSHAE